MTQLLSKEGRYDTSCHSSFEKIVPNHVSQGRPTSSDKLAAFSARCDKMEDDSELYTIKLFHDIMQKEGHDVYSQKITKVKVKEKCGDSLQFVNREGRINIILLHYVGSILTKSWYDPQKSDQCDEAEGIIKTATQILKDVIKNDKNETDFYSNVDDIGHSS